MDELQGLIGQTATPRERAAKQYIINAFKSKMSSLIPFAFENKSVLELASYLLKHTTGSSPTLYQYVFGVHRFSNWIKKSPDNIVKEAMLDVKARDRFIISIDEFVGEDCIAWDLILSHF